MSASVGKAHPPPVLVGVSRPVVCGGRDDVLLKTKLYIPGKAYMLHGCWIAHEDLCFIQPTKESYLWHFVEQTFETLCWSVPKWAAGGCTPGVSSYALYGSLARMEPGVVQACFGLKKVNSQRFHEVTLYMLHRGLGPGELNRLSQVCVLWRMDMSVWISNVRNVLFTSNIKKYSIQAGWQARIASLSIHSACGINQTSQFGEGTGVYWWKATG